MSFSGTPLGQGRRLDHSTFLGKPTSNGNAATVSYAYGAPTLGSRSPPKPTSSTRSRHTLQEGEEDENEPALARFARIKQRESTSNLPGAPKVITSPPKPEKWSVKDTSVNIATAFTQAATDMNPTYTNPNNSWASTSRANLSVPRSTSVEYEATAPTTFNRKHLAPPPPDRLGRATTTARKPLSKTPSIRHVPDSEGEEEARGKSPFERVVDLGKQALSQATFYVRQRSMSREPEEPSIEQRPAVNGNGNESSYDYADEEEAYQATQQKRHSAHRRGRISVDNKAYKPPVSESESEWSDDGKTRRKKKKKGGPTGGPLSTLPVLSADKAKKKKKKNSRKFFETQEDESESEEDLQEIQSLQRTSIPRNSNPSNSHISQELPSYDDGDISMEGAEQGLHSIPEVDEQLLDDLPLQPQRLRSRTPAPRSPTSMFSIGGLLGSIVHYVIKILISLFSAIVSFLSLIAFVCGHVAGTIYDIILRRPGNWLASISPRSTSFVKYLVLGLTILGAWYTLRGVSLPSYLPNLSFPSHSDVYQPPEIPAGNIAELAERLRRMEMAVSADTDRTSGRGFSELLGRLSALEVRLTEMKKALETDAKARDLAGRSMNGVKHDMEILQSQIMAQQVQHEKEQRERTGEANDAETKRKALEERVGTVEGGVKEALELGKKTSTSTLTGPVSAWWTKLLTSSNSKIQIKSSDGQDVTALIHHLVDSAISTITQDIIAKPDFALHSGGARIIPSLTSPTFEIRPQSLGSQMIGLVTGSGYAIGRPPITALHHEMQNGHCWPFAGGEGQLGVALASPIFVEEVTIDHVAKSIAFDMRSAPRQMEVWGLVEGKDNIARVRAWKEDIAARKEAEQLSVEQSSTTNDQDGSDGSYDGYSNSEYPKTLPKYPEYIRLANFTYNIYSSNNVQTYPVMPEIRELGIDFGIVVLRVLNNWGRDDFTCLYRFRVHGQRLAEIPVPYPEDVHGQP
ncbi:hypothetical protein BYT27DRAFT_7137253 [Phlegmacium glaucopus]|nr:hypothetical protein BYT27DRAFT_7137253 [Phlegmacium glaucopus]